MRQERDAASRAEFESLRQLQQELAAEAVATLELLNKAESMVMASAGGTGVREDGSVRTHLPGTPERLSVPHCS